MTAGGSPRLSASDSQRRQGPAVASLPARILRGCAPVAHPRGPARRRGGGGGLSSRHRAITRRRSACMGCPRSPPRASPRTRSGGVSRHMERPSLTVLRVPCALKKLPPFRRLLALPPSVEEQNVVYCSSITAGVSFAHLRALKTTAAPLWQRHKGVCSIIRAHHAICSGCAAYVSCPLAMNSSAE